MESPTSWLNEASEETEKKDFKVVIAIDFGTAYSGYAYSYSDQPNNVHLNRNWGEGRQSCYKTPTVMNISNDGTFKSFGIKALDDYITMYDDHDIGLQPLSSLCSEVKMSLMSQINLGLDMKVTSNNGNTFLAIDVISSMLNYLKGSAIEEIQKQHVQEIPLMDIRWVITVPAIWPESAKLFMREAAKKAGIIESVDSDQLLIALEPEAGSYYCRDLPIDRFSSSIDDISGLNMAPESQYMVIDAGGGTVDIVVHELTYDGTIIERQLASGGPCGGTYVNKEFEKIMKNVFGEDYVTQFNDRSPNNWLEIMLCFEEKKQQFKSNSDKLYITLDRGLYSFLSGYKEKQGNAYSDPRDMGFDMKINTSQWKLNIGISLIKQCYDEVVDNILQFIDLHTDFEDTSDKFKLNYIFLIGGFASSDYLYNTIKEKYSHICPVLVPKEPSIAVLKGAVLFGLNPKMIVTRVSRYTYAYMSCITCDEKPQNEERIAVMKDGIYKVETLFPIVLKNQKVTLGTSIKETMKPLHPDQTALTVTIYCTEKINIDDPYDPEVKEIGFVCVESPDISKGEDRDLEVKFILGDTEMKIHGKDVESGNTDESSVTFNLLDKIPQ